MLNKIISIFVLSLLIVTVEPLILTLETDQEDMATLYSKILYSESSFYEQFDSVEFKITKPEKAIYLNDEKIFPLFIATIIIGPITIETDITTDSAEKVEFYIDNNLKYSDNSEPFSYYWNENVFFKHIIKIKAYHGNGDITEDEISVWIFNKPQSQENNIKINEILFYPTENELYAGMQNYSIEWIEIFNPGTTSQNLASWTISNHNGNIITSLPNWILPSNSYLTIHFGSGENDNDFIDSYGHFWTGDDNEFFDDTEDECALYSGPPSSNTIVDFLSWCSDDNYKTGTAHKYATTAGIWNDGDYINTTSLGKIDTLGRYFNGFDNDLPDDWKIYYWNEFVINGISQPQNPIQISPENYLIIDDATPTLDWFDVPNIDHYHIQVDNNIDFSSPEIDESGIIPSEFSLLNPLDHDLYFFRIRGTGESSYTHWSAVWMFAIQEVQTSKCLSCPFKWQHKDTSLTCIWDCATNTRPGCEEGGNHPWDSPHPDGPPQCPHCNNYCARASIAMVNGRYGGDLSQDRISYHYFKEIRDRVPGPEGDLGHDAWLVGQDFIDTISWALNGAAINSIQRPPGGFTFAQMQGWINQLDCFVINIPGHVCVADGYAELSMGNKIIQAVSVHDPARGPYQQKIYTWQNIGAPQPVDAWNHRITWVFLQPATGVTARMQEASVTTDSDNDGLMDFDELNRYHTDINDVDTENDEVNDKQEVRSYTFHDVDTGHDNDALNFPDIDGDGLRAELDCDSDNDGDFDGGEDINGDGIAYNSALETDVYNCNGDENEIWIDVELVEIGFCLYEVYLIGQTFHENSMYFYEFSTICAPPQDGDPLGWSGWFFTDDNGIIIRKLIAIVSMGCYRVVADVLTDALYSEPDNWDPWKIFIITCPFPYDVYVDDDFTEDTLGWGYTHFPTIQAGINGVNYFGTVHVYDGTYYENIEINKSLNLIAEDLYPVINGMQTGDCITITSNNVTIDGFEIKQGVRGIDIFNSYNISVINNYIHCNPEGIRFDGIDGVTGENYVNHNRLGIYGEILIGVINNADDVIIDARWNWWSSPGGPSGETIDPITGEVADGYGDQVIGNVNFDPWAGVCAKADVSTYVAGVGEPILFDGSESYAYHLDGTPNSIDFYWDFDDGSYSFEESTTHVYLAPGTYNPYLRVSAYDEELWPGAMYDFDDFTIMVLYE